MYSVLGWYMRKTVHGVEQDLPIPGHRARGLGHRRGLRLAEPDIRDLQHKREHDSEVQVRPQGELEQDMGGHYMDSTLKPGRLPADIELSYTG
jgi:hypothetical protein